MKNETLFPIDAPHETSAVSLYDEVSSVIYHNFDMPDELPSESLERARIVLNWVEKHPQHWGLGFGVLKLLLCTKQEAADLTIQVWQYMAEHPDIVDKADLPATLFNLIKYYDCECPICHIHNNCDDCPLDNDITKRCEFFSQWDTADTPEKRTEAALKIVKVIKDWKEKRAFRKKTLAW